MMMMIKNKIKIKKMSSLVGLGARGMSGAASWIAKIGKTALRYAPQVIDFAAQAAPVAGQGLDFLVTKFSKSKRNYNFGEMGSKLRENYNDSRTKRLESSRMSRGGRGNRGLPAFEDDLENDDIYNDNYGQAPISRRQYGRGSQSFFDREDYRDDYEENEDTFDNAYQGNRGFKRPFNPYSERSFGNGYGRNSSYIANNELTRGRRGFNDDEEDEMDYIATTREEYAPSYKKRRTFQRRQSEPTSSRYGGSRVSNLNFEEDDYLSAFD